MKYFLIVAWISTGFSINANGENLRIRLLAEVTVQSEMVRLSDLLPDHAGTQLTVAAGKLSLGHAPQAGSQRVFTASALRSALAEISNEATQIDIPEQVLVRRLSWSLEAETIRRTLASSRLTYSFDLSQARIMLPAGFTTEAPNPQLEVTALRPNPDYRRLTALMRCRERAACGSFLAEILLSATACKKILETSLSSEAAPVLVHPGHLALLAIEGDGFRITEAVMPLKRARLGELVRVSDPLTHRSRAAQVSGEGMLRTLTAKGKEEAE